MVLLVEHEGPVRAYLGCKFSQDGVQELRRAGRRPRRIPPVVRTFNLRIASDDPSTRDGLLAEKVAEMSLALDDVGDAFFQVRARSPASRVAALKG